MKTQNTLNTIIKTCIIIGSLITPNITHAEPNQSPATVDSDYTGSPSPDTTVETKKYKLNLGVSQYLMGKKTEGMKRVDSDGQMYTGDIEYKIFNPHNSDGRPVGKKDNDWLVDSFVPRLGGNFQLNHNNETQKLDAMDINLSIGDIAHFLYNSDRSNFSFSILPASYHIENNEYLEIDTRALEIALVSFSFHHKDICGAIEIAKASFSGELHGFDVNVSEFQPISVMLCAGRSLGESIGYLQGSASLTTSSDINSNNGISSFSVGYKYGADMKGSLGQNNLVTNGKIALINTAGIKGLNLNATAQEKNRNITNLETQKREKKRESIMAVGLEVTSDIFN